MHRDKVMLIRKLNVLRASKRIGVTENLSTHGGIEKTRLYLF